MDFIWLYVTTKDKDEAVRIGSELVQSRLVACVNILENMTSMYWWKGKVQHETEAVLIAKSRQSLSYEIIEKIKSLHSYSCPCIVALPLVEGNDDFLSWIKEETKAQEG